MLPNPHANGKTSRATNEPDPTYPGPRWRSWAGWVVLSALAVMMAKDFDWRGTVAATAGADPIWLILALTANGTILVLATAQWLLFLPEGAWLPGKTMFGIVAVTSSVSNGGPPLAGHAAGARLLATRGELGNAAGVSVTILDQLAEGMTKLVVVAAAALFVPGFRYGLAVAFIVLIPALVAGFTLLAHRRDRLEDIAARHTGRAGSVMRFLATTAHHLGPLRRPGHFAVGVLIGVAQKIVEGLAIAAVALALGITLPPWVVLAVVLAVSFSTLVAVTPANIGGYEGSAFLVFRSAGMDTDSALALAVIQHAVYLIPLAGTGWIWESARLWGRTRSTP